MKYNGCYKQEICDYGRKRTGSLGKQARTAVNGFLRFGGFDVPSRVLYCAVLCQTNGSTTRSSCASWFFYCLGLLDLVMPSFDSIVPVSQPASSYSRWFFKNEKNFPIWNRKLSHKVSRDRSCAREVVRAMEVLPRTGYAEHLRLNVGLYVRFIHSALRSDTY